jgi:hypothetical protein
MLSQRQGLVLILVASTTTFILAGVWVLFGSPQGPLLVALIGIALGLLACMTVVALALTGVIRARRQPPNLNEDVANGPRGEPD